ncbi:MAG: tRNA threonylcarbamoyladenosine dehydratase, partial [Oscillospiraceae bacterium]
MLNEFSRTELLIGEKAMKKLSSASVIVFGVGGVGSYCVESLVRSGIGKIVLVDNDTVSLTNINRQLIATHKTVGKLKVDVAKERILEINPTCVVETHTCFYSQDETDGIDLSAADFVVDAIDSVKSKLFIISQCDQLKTPIISCMGAGNKLDPTKFKIADIYKTEMCPLAKVMRRELRIMGIKHLKVLFST